MPDPSPSTKKLRRLLALTFLLMAGAILASVLITAQMNQALPEPWRQQSFVMSIVVPSLISPPIWAVIALILVRNHKLMTEVDRIARHDELTGLLNRRAFLAEGEAALCSLDRPVSVAIMDIDWFKRINDTYGHRAGDQAIAAVGKALSTLAAPGCVPARVGGDEFALIFCGLSDTQVEAQIATLRARISELRIALEGREPEEFGITASFGLAHRSDQAETLDGLLARADVALYSAKHGGRNRASLAA